MNARVEPKASLTTPAISTEEGPKFYGSGQVDKKQFLFGVNAGVDLTDALNSISDLLDTIEGPICDAGMGEPLQDNAAWRVHFILKAAWRVHFILKAAKAAVDSLWHASIEADRIAKELASLSNSDSAAATTAKE